MSCDSLFNNKAIPEEYRKTAESLFPAEGFTEKKSLSLKAATDFAIALGIGADFKKLVSLKKITDAEIHNFLESFQNNLDLLIQKTWVEKADEGRKEILLNNVPGFVDVIEKGNFQKALEEFGAILDELSYLFFGAQSTKEDFTEYTFRIDDQMGLFWWYGTQLGCIKEVFAVKTADTDGAANDEALWAVLLIGICFLTNF
ncbi:MAG: hypothetical protein FWF29_05125 [Treponema sp.]|nr:hypothetical protein [Treponema sp.]